MKNSASTFVTGLGQIWARIREKVKTPINAVIGFINRLGNGIESVAKKFGISVSVPDIAALGGGGSVQSVPGIGDTVPASWWPGAGAWQRTPSQPC